MSGRDSSSVGVALRMRPLVKSEISRGCKSAVELYQEAKQVKIKGTDKAFTFDHTFDERSSQEEFYNVCASPLIDNLFKGYNVTILAYGQTGSGKTHSMGTAYNGEGEMGIIPRMVQAIFNNIRDRFTYKFTVTVSFMELYQEVLYDLLSTKPREQTVVEIREDVSRSIYIPGLTEQIVTDVQSTLECLSKGSLGRATSCTNMNSQSSRSHAIFTINITMEKKGDGVDTLKSAKLHLVDLAGSERPKKTGATGQTFKEGININKGLLALGNVISALGEEATYIGYRDSNLTRLLKDSLGGNSITLMIACISPADYNIEETISTLRYADRAKKIKNKPIVNEDPQKAEINRLKRLVDELKLELGGQGGPSIRLTEFQNLKIELGDARGKISEMNGKLSVMVTENAALFERIMIMQTANEVLSEKLAMLKKSYNDIMDKFAKSLDGKDIEEINEYVAKFRSIQQNLNELDELYKKNEEEIRQHEVSTAKSHIENRDDSTEKEICDMRNDHTEYQMQMNEKLQEVTKMLGLKEDLAKQLMANVNYTVDVEEIAQDQAKLNAWEKEREKLTHALKQAQQGNDTTTKITETRRKRIQELEGQIKTLRKKVMEQDRMIKLKEQDEKRIQLLNKEIQSIKSNKVDLIKKMRQESEKYRQWKISRERELCKLKDQDRKRQNQIVKMETIHSRQQNVLKRKMEEIAAVNKRLKDALSLKKAAQHHRAGKVENVEAWIRREMDVYISCMEARAALNVMLEDRAELQSRIDKMQEEESLGVGALEEELEFRSLQIANLQQKLLENPDEEEKSKVIANNVNTMAESKEIIKTLMEIMGEVVKKNASKTNDDSQYQYDLEKKFAEEKSRLETEMQEQIMKFEMKCEQKMSVVLKQLRGVDVENNEEKMSKLLIERSEKLEKENSELAAKLAKIQAELEAAKQNSNNISPPIATIKIEKVNIKKECMDDDTITMRPPKQPRKKERSSEESNTLVPTPLSLNNGCNTPTINMIDEDIVEETPRDNKTLDPDWTKTRLAKRMQKARKHDSLLPVKRTSKGGCSCKGLCSNRTCGCKKAGVDCNGGCHCNEEKCINRSKENETNGDADITEETYYSPAKKIKPSSLQGKKIDFSDDLSS